MMGVKIVPVEDDTPLVKWHEESCFAHKIFRLNVYFN
jgi:hypothetical protein